MSNEALVQCDVCKRMVCTSFIDRGHIHDKFMGGPDTDDNVTPMCCLCNQRKPGHMNREEYESWIEGGYWKEELYRIVVQVETEHHGCIIDPGELREDINIIEDICHEFEIAYLHAYLDFVLAELNSRVIPTAAFQIANAPWALMLRAA